MVVFPTNVYKEELGLSDDTPAAVKPDAGAISSSPVPDHRLPYGSGPAASGSKRQRQYGRAPGVTVRAPGVIVVPDDAPVDGEPFTVDGEPFTVDTGDITKQDYFDQTNDREVRGSILNSVVAEELRNNGQDPEIAIKLNLKPSHPSDPLDVDESELLNTESEFGKKWLFAAKILSGHFIDKGRAKQKKLPGWLGSPMTPPAEQRLATYGSPLAATGLVERETEERIRGQGFTALFTDIGVEGLLDADLSQAGLDFMGHNAHNISFGGATWAEMDEMSPEVQVALAGLLDLYEKLPDFTWSGTGRLLKGMLGDITTYMGSLAGLKVVKALLAGGAKGVGKNVMRDQLLRKIYGSAFVGVEGSGYAALQDLIMQRQQAGDNPDWKYDATRGGLAAGSGFAFGAALPTAIPAIGKAVAATAKAVGRAAEPGLARSVVGVPPIPAKVVPKMTRAEAMADTRQGREFVAARLEVLVPQKDRLASGGKYKPGQPNGRPWSDLTEKELAKLGPGFRGTDDDVRRMLAEAISESSVAAQEAARETGMHITLSAADWDKALKLPKRAQLWYELSGEGFKKRLPILKSGEQFTLFTDVTGVTSPLTKPIDNLKRTLATMSQHLRHEPMDVDVVHTEPVREALARVGARQGVPGLKTGNFSDTLAMVGGAKVPVPIPVNDVWVGKLFGVTEDDLGANQSLHEPMAMFWNKMRNYVNAASGKNVLPHESWQLQSRTWVSERGAQDDYDQALDIIVDELRAAGIPGITKDGKITEKAFKHPDFATTLRPTMLPYREAAKATVEVGTKLTQEGRKAAASIVALRKMPDNPKAVRLIEDYTKIHTGVIYHSSRGPGNMWDKIYQSVMDLPAGDRISRISKPRSDRPLDVAGSFNGTFSPNIRIPLRGMSDDQVSLFNAIAGTGLRQDAMASSRITTVLDASTPVASYRDKDGNLVKKTRGQSVFIETPKSIDGQIIEDFYKLLPEGFEVSTDRTANGYLIDINPKFTDAGPEGITDIQLAPAFQMLHARKLNAKRLFHDHSSVYNESGEFTPRIERFRQELNDGVIEELGEKLGWTEARARRYIDGRGIGKVTHAQRGRAETARSRYKRRLGNLDKSLQAADEVGESVNTGYILWNEKARNVLPERITSAAIRLPDGTIVEGTTHGVAINKAREGGLLEDWPEAGLNPWEFQDAGGHLDLFKTSSDRVIDRFEASQTFGISAAEDVKP